MTSDEWDALKAGDRIVGPCGIVRTVASVRHRKGSAIVACPKLRVTWAFGSPNAYLYPEIARLYRVVGPEKDAFIGDGI